MNFSVKANLDDRAISMDRETAKEAFAKAVEWQVVRKFPDVTISDGVKDYSIMEFSSVIASLQQASR